METKKAFWFFIIFAFLFSSCAKPIKPEKPLSFKKASTSENKTDNETDLEAVLTKELKEHPQVSEPEPVKLPQYRPTEPVKLKTPTPPKEEEAKPLLDYKALVGVKEPVILNVEAMPLNDFIVYALGELLKVPFLVDENVMKMTNPVTLRLPRPLPPEEVLEAVVAYLGSLGLEVTSKGKVLSIIKPKPSPAPPPPVQQIHIGTDPLDTPARIAQFVPLKYIGHFELQTFLNDFIKDKGGVEIKSYPRENALLLIGPGYQIKELLEIIKLFDVPTFSERKLYYYKATFWQAEELSKELSNMLSKFGYPVANSLKDPGILLIPIKSLNALLMAFPEEKALNFTLDWLKKLDSPEAAGQEVQFYIYKPLYSKAVDLATSLNNLLSGKIAAQPASPSPAPTTPSPQPGKPSPQTSPSKSTTFSTQGLTISADEKRNLLLISSTPSNYQLILKLLRELDRPPKQVLIEATILELTLKDDLKLGLEWYLRNRMTEGNFTLGQIFGVPTSPGFTFTFITDTQRFNLLINAFASKGLTNILSTPRLMVLDNQAATIQVGTDVPIVTGEVTTAQAAGANPGVVRSIQYRNTGVILNVKPTIYTEGLLQLEISQEVSEMGTSPPGISSPTILVRKINTNVIAGDGQTIVLGGLISNTQGREESKVPLLGDIPLLGNLFKSQSREERKTELIVLLTPYIINNLDEAKAVTEEIKSRLKWLK